ncbi:MAG TPA: YbhB/YbcL family Raf kinase inhibitor-like protein [Sandaracinaceae bacterium LLY-WYZ-13_1]|nr:YbhB/YbcL family Raf kinase inhibitor-like protein [Sandaracinaceae bacterium LLY-WYZ-13_1]
MAMTLTSTAFPHEGEIPRRYTCEGDDVSPPLTWGDPPEDAASLVLIVSDPDAPDPAAPKTTWAHWVLYDLPPEAGALEEGVRALPAGTREGLNDWKRTGWGGPCPPTGRHRYFFELFALDRTLGDLGAPTRAQLLARIEGRVLMEATLMGTYEKQG